jgi:hypothetical protein
MPNLYRRQPDWLRNAFPLAKPIDSQPKDRLEFASGSYVLGIPGGADQLRGYHPGDTSTMKLLSSRRPVSVITRLSPRSRGRSSCVQLPDQDGTPIFDTTSSATTKIEVLDRFPPSCVHDGQGLNTETPVIATSRVLRVTNVRLCFRAVAARRPSITGSGDFAASAFAAIPPQRSATA